MQSKLGISDSFNSAISLANGQTTTVTLKHQSCDGSISAGLVSCCLANLNVYILSFNMKKLLLLLLFIPLISFGQAYSDIPWKIEYGIPLKIKKNGDGITKYTQTTFDDGVRVRETWEHYWDRTNNENYIKEEVHKVRGLIAYERKFIVQNVQDGWARMYKGREIGRSNQQVDEVCREAFFISGFIVYESNSTCNSYRYNTLSSMRRRYVNEYDLEPMVNVFLSDLINHNRVSGSPSALITSFGGNIKEAKSMPGSLTAYERFDKNKRPKIKATFEPLEGDALALSYGFKDDKNIILKVDPEKWAKASSAKRWYTLYHELGHDVLNYEHGQGGKMMFNFADRDYTWETFEKDRNYMFKKYLNN